MTWRMLARGELSWETLRCRSRILEWTRAFFRERGFLEVDPPIAQPYPNIDPNVFPVQVSDAAGRTSGLYLHASPEPSMKKLLAAGSGNIFYLGKVFRNREGSPLPSSRHALEWFPPSPRLRFPQALITLSYAISPPGRKRARWISPG